LIPSSPILPRTSPITTSGTPAAVKSPSSIFNKASHLAKAQEELLLNTLPPKLSIRSGLPSF
jgi:hypothetical protein